MEELQKILSNEELDNNAKEKAIKDLIGDNYVPTTKYSDDVASVKKENKTLKTTLETTQKELEGYKENQLTDEQKIQKINEKIEAREKEINKKENKLEVREILSEIVTDKVELQTLVDNITTDNLEISKQLAETLASTMKKQKADIETRTKQELIDDTPKPEGGDPKDKTISKEEFMKLDYNSQVEYKTNNPEGYKQIFN